jgi:hypothetical protein
VIETMDDLVAYLEQAAADDPVLGEDAVLRSPGCSERELERLATLLPGMPETYLACLRTYALAGITIGYFALSPHARDGQDVVDALVDQNDPTTVVSGEVATRNRFIVAAFESDWLCVAGRDGESPGRVWRIDLGSGPEPSFSPVAESFADVLILAGRLDEMAGAGAEGQLPILEFLDSLQPLGLTDEEIGNWRFFAQMTFLVD